MRMRDRRDEITSPYLLDHIDNPVDWWEWGQEAFAEARRRDVPIFLSVGYAACHWCHVMAHESFEDEAVAAVLNDGFVAIKVDREERPDVDSAYMAATTALTGRGGWPMSVWLDHDGRPFYAGTYFPPRSRPGMPGFTEVLAAVSEAWTNRRGDVERTSGQVQEVLARRREAPRAFADRAAMVAPPDLAQVTADAVVALAGDFDAARGGFGGAPKFPPSMVLEFLLRHHVRTGDPAALEMVAQTCDAMARGGMYDQLGGGFARYSVDSGWVVPHFEKMLYDNALLLRVYAHWWRLTGEPLARRVAMETAEFLVRDLRTAEGGFASALDADSLPAQQASVGAVEAAGPGAPADTPGVSVPEPAAGAGAGAAPVAVEGAAYVWTPAELTAVLGPADGAWAAALLGVTAAGTFEHGASTLQLRADPDDPQRWERLRARLLAARDQRPAPARDDKVVAAWNGLAIAALAEAGAILDRPGWIEAAEAAADLLLAVHLTDDGGLLRVSRDGAPGRAKGVLEDFADVAEGFLALYWATGAAEWFELAEDLLGGAVGRFDSGGGVFVDNEPDGILAPESDAGDNAYPSGSSALASALLSVASLGGGSPADLRATVEAMVAAQVPVMANHPRFAGWWLSVAEALLAGPLEVAVVGDADDPAREALARVARQSPAPGLVLAVGAPGDVVPPLLVEREPRDGRATAYVCHGFVCEQPTDSAAELSVQLGG